MKDDGCYDNRFSSTLLFKARSNTLKLKDFNRFTNKDTSCSLCGDEREDLVHFLIGCNKLEESRDKTIMEKYRDVNKEKMVGRILHTEKDIEAVKAMIEKMWYLRKKG